MMLARFWDFAEACDQSHTMRAVRDLLAGAVRDLGFESFALLTHTPRDDARSLSVLVHNWPSSAIDHVFGEAEEGPLNPLFEIVEQAEGPVIWSSLSPQAGLDDVRRAWITQLSARVRGDGVSQAMRSTLVNASCSLVGPPGFRAERVTAGMRMANYAFHHIQYLQRPDLSEAQRLTAREHECLYRAAVCGERPSVVARQLGVKVSTVRTLRQKANARLDADSPEQAVWRMLETGQLFRRGRKSKPRTW